MGAPWYGEYYSPFVQIQRQEDSAMLMQSIVKKILSYSSIADLKLKRLVCKQWNEEGCKILREKLIINFNDYHRIKSFTVRMHYHKDFCENFYLGPEICLQAPVVTYFLTEFGHHIRSIEIRNSDQMNLTALKHALYYYMPNLEKLTLDTRISYYGGMFPEAGRGFLMSSMFEIPQLWNLKKLSLCIEYSPELASQIYLNHKNNCVREPTVPLLLQEILLAAINLEEISSAKREGPSQAARKFEMNDLNVEHCDYILDQPFISDFNIWSTLLDDRGGYFFPKLHKIDLNVKLSNQCVLNLATKWFPITSLDLNLGPYVTNRNLQYLFSSLKETLSKIKLKYDCREKRPEYEVDLPIAELLNNVITVDLESYQGSIKFVENIPNLKGLIFRRVHFNKIILQDNEDYSKSSSASLRSLKVHGDHSNNDEGRGRKRSIETVQKLGQLFPCLTRLRLEKLVDDSLCLIYAQWPGLEELEIVEGRFTDAGTTGIHPNAYRVILREEAYDLFNLEALRQGLYIGNLTKLTRLSIHSATITDVSMILGVIECPSLESLYVQSYWITDTALRRLLTKQNLVQIETENCHQLSKEMIAFAKQKLQKLGRHSQFNENKDPLNCFQVRDFLLKYPKAKVVLKRLNNIPKLCKKNPSIQICKSNPTDTQNDKLDLVAQSQPVKRRRGRPPVNRNNGELHLVSLAQPAKKRRGRPPVIRNDGQFDLFNLAKSAKKRRGRPPVIQNNSHFDLVNLAKSAKKRRGRPPIWQKNGQFHLINLAQPLKIRRGRPPIIRNNGQFDLANLVQPFKIRRGRPPIVRETGQSDLVDLTQPIQPLKIRRGRPPVIRNNGQFDLENFVQPFKIRGGRSPIIQKTGQPDLVDLTQPIQPLKIRRGHPPFIWKEGQSDPLDLAQPSQPLKRKRGRPRIVRNYQDP